NPYQVADTGAYRVYLYAIDRRPEHLPSAITPGDTVTGEDIGLPGDVDEFTFDGAAGAEFNVFLQGQNGLPNTRVQVEVLDGAGRVLLTAESAGNDTSLLRQLTGRFALPGTGTYRLRVSGLESYGGEHYRGPYRLFLYRVNRRRPSERLLSGPPHPAGPLSPLVLSIRLRPRGGVGHLRGRRHRIRRGDRAVGRRRSVPLLWSEGPAHQHHGSGTRRAVRQCVSVFRYSTTGIAWIWAVH